MINKNVKDFMTSPAIYCEEDTTIDTAISILKEHNIGFLPITKNNILTGVITDRDILLRHGNHTKIGEIMSSTNLQFVSPSDPITEAAEMMANSKVRRLVVLNDGKVIGVLTSKSLLKEPSLINYIIKTYEKENTLNEYAIFDNSNPHDSIKVSDYPL